MFKEESIRKKKLIYHRTTEKEDFGGLAYVEHLIHK